MIIEKYEVHNLEDSISAIGLSYGEAYNKERGEKVASKLSALPSNSGELNFLTGVTVNMMVNASIKWWQQAERYHWFQIVMSQSVMHSITHKEFSEMEFAGDTPTMTKESFKRRIEAYHAGDISDTALIYSVPVGLKEKAYVSTNYLQLLTMYKQRHNHKLPEWHDFCRQVEGMPMMAEIIARQKVKK